ncbi:MAG TPA: CocE/NonD family hydrolase [Solirubrobacteraceae bacterium]|nr:CocE/NonD family hydrolase [Solirubrobacteraceae bacterium]
MRSLDGITIRAHFYPATNRAGDERVPTVLIGPGYPTLGDTNPDADTSHQIGQRTLRAEGYNTLTWDPRGIGGSGGTVQFDSPDYEARDVQALIDFVGTAPEALLDAPSDPGVGVSGSSYGGAIQLATAAIDSRLDAIVPDVTWHNLGTGFFPEGAMRTFFAVSICRSGPAANGIPGNLLGPAAALLDRAAAPIKTACLESLGGTVNPASRQFFIDRTPPGLRERVNTPTLITQGTVDTFFGLSEAVANYRALRSRDVPVKMVWHCGGHGRCTTSTGEDGHLKRAGLSWLNRYLTRNETVDTGAPFEWLADDGIWRSGSGYPLPPAGAVEASGANFKSLGVSLVDSTASGRDGIAGDAGTQRRHGRLHDTPDGERHRRRLASEDHLHGHRGVAEHVSVRADRRQRANRVIGSQVTPLPVVLDDQARSVERDLQPIAAHAGANERYRVQITPGTGVFGPQHSVGGVILRKVDGWLPLVNAGGAGGGTARALALRAARVAPAPGRG